MLCSSLLCRVDSIPLRDENLPALVYLAFFAPSGSIKEEKIERIRQFIVNNLEHFEVKEYWVEILKKQDELLNIESDKTDVHYELSVAFETPSSDSLQVFEKLSSAEKVDKVYQDLIVHDHVPSSNSTNRNSVIGLLSDRMYLPSVIDLLVSFFLGLPDTQLDVFILRLLPSYSAELILAKFVRNCPSTCYRIAGIICHEIDRSDHSSDQVLIKRYRGILMVLAHCGQEFAIQVRQLLTSRKDQPDLCIRISCQCIGDVDIYLSSLISETCELKSHWLIGSLKDNDADVVRKCMIEKLESLSMKLSEKAIVEREILAIQQRLSRVVQVLVVSSTYIDSNPQKCFDGDLLGSDTSLSDIPATFLSMTDSATESSNDHEFLICSSTVLPPTDSIDKAMQILAIGVDDVPETVLFKSRIIVCLVAMKFAVKEISSEAKDSEQQYQQSDQPQQDSPAESVFDASSLTALRNLLRALKRDSFKSSTLQNLYFYIKAIWRINKCPVTLCIKSLVGGETSFATSPGKSVEQIFECIAHNDNVRSPAIFSPGKVTAAYSLYYFLSGTLGLSACTDFLKLSEERCPPLVMIPMLSNLESAFEEVVDDHEQFDVVENFKQLEVPVEISGRSGIETSSDWLSCLLLVLVCPDIERVPTDTLANKFESDAASYLRETVLNVVYRSRWPLHGCTLNVLLLWLHRSVGIVYTSMMSSVPITFEELGHKAYQASLKMAYFRPFESTLLAKLTEPLANLSLVSCHNDTEIDLSEDEFPIGSNSDFSPSQASPDGSLSSFLPSYALLLDSALDNPRNQGIPVWKMCDSCCLCSQKADVSKSICRGSCTLPAVLSSFLAAKYNSFACSIHPLGASVLALDFRSISMKRVLQVVVAQAIALRKTKLSSMQLHHVHQTSRLLLSTLISMSKYTPELVLWNAPMNWLLPSLLSSSHRGNFETGCETFHSITDAISTLVPESGDSSGVSFIGDSNMMRKTLTLTNLIVRSINTVETKRVLADKVLPWFFRQAFSSDPLTAHQEDASTALPCMFLWEMWSKIHRAHPFPQQFELESFKLILRKFTNDTADFLHHDVNSSQIHSYNSLVKEPLVLFRLPLTAFCNPFVATLLVEVLRSVLWASKREVCEALARKKQRIENCTSVPVPRSLAASLSSVDKELASIMRQAQVFLHTQESIVSRSLLYIILRCTPSKADGENLARSKACVKPIFLSLLGQLLSEMPTIAEILLSQNLNRDEFGVMLSFPFVEKAIVAIVLKNVVFPSHGVCLVPSMAPKQHEHNFRILDGTYGVEDLAMLFTYLRFLFEALPQSAAISTIAEEAPRFLIRSLKSLSDFQGTVAIERAFLEVSCALTKGYPR
jgi:hypothetical protein